MYRLMIGVKTSDRGIVPVFDSKKLQEKKVFTTTVDNQKKAVFQFYQRSSDDSDWKPAGSIMLKNIPEAPAGKPSLSLYLSVNRSREIVSRIVDPVSGISAHFRIGDEKSTQKDGEAVLSYTPASTEYDAGPSVSLPPALKNQHRKIRRRLIPVLIVFIAAGILVSACLQLFLWKPADIKIPGIIKNHLQKILSKSDPVYYNAPDEAPGPKRENIYEEKVKETGYSPERLSQETKTSLQQKLIPAIEPEKQDVSSPASGVVANIEKEKNTQRNIEQNETALQVYPDTTGKQESSLYSILYGDTLWRISKKYYGEAHLFHELAQENSIPDPDYIIAGETLLLPEEIEHKKRIDMGK